MTILRHRKRAQRPTVRLRKLSLEALEVRSLLHGGGDQALTNAWLANSQESFYFPTTTHLQNYGQFLTSPAPGTPLQAAWDFLNSQGGELRLNPSDPASYRISSQYTDDRSGNTHLYLRQAVAGLEVMNADLDIHLTARGEVIKASSNFVPVPPTADISIQPALSAAQALAALNSSLGNSLLPTPQIVGSDWQSPQLTTVLAADGSGLQVAQANLVFVPTPLGLTLAWQLQTSDQQHWYDALVAADSGETLYVGDRLAYASYRVFPAPLESPNDGSRSLVTDPQEAIASPWGWHDTDGIAGADFTDTRGNNVSAQEDADANNAGGFRPSGGASLNFDFPFDPAQDPALFQSAAITNAFYWVNLLHDIHYQYGFTEAAGNFQVNNYGRGGIGNDPVIVDVQDGDGGTDSFNTFPDGQSPRMSLYRRTSPYRDRAYDSDILIHEYGHGISQRLTGGPGNTTSLNATQSKAMGEGWGDWWALMLTQVATDAKLGVYPIGNYAAGFPINGPGIRQYPYSFDMAIEPLTYNSYNGGVVNNEEHKAGAIWCSVLWDMNWLLIDKYGFSSDMHHGTGGNNLALQLVMDGLKLQNTNPSFLSARDAILAADVALNGGQNQSEIWTAFARRGMGFSASDGGGAGATTVVQAFDVPSSIRGRVFRDDDGDGVQSSAEPGLPGWNVYRDKNSNGVIDVPTVATFNSVDTPRTIPDGPNMLSTRTVSGLAGVITDINVTVNLTHPYVGELYVTLISPANTPVILANYLGGSGDNYTNTTFDDEAATYISTGSPPFTGSFKPYFNLAQLDGRDPNGTWKLRLDDAVSGNTGTLLNWSLQISYGTPDPQTTTDASGNYSFFGIGDGTHQIREVVQPGFTQTTPAGGFHNVVIFGGQPASDRNFGNTPATFHVLDAALTNTGAVVNLSRDVDLALLNLYDVSGNPLGPADFTLVGATTGNAKGSLIVDPDQRRLTFVKTSGVLAPDSYTLTLRSAANGFRDTGGALLDGDADGVAGGDFVRSFLVSPPPGDRVTVSLPNFARGPQQPVNLPANGNSGLPISFSDGNGITSASFQLRYNPALLTISDANVAPGLPVGAQVTLDTATTPGVATFQFSSPTPLPAGTARFLDLQAAVPTTATYLAKQVLDLTNIVLNGGVIPAADDDAVQVNAYFGDTTGNGTYSSQDATNLARLAVGLGTGVQVFKLLDPTIIADITGNGGFSSADTSRLQQASVVIAVPELPPLPFPAVSLVSGGPDPKLSIPRNLGAATGGELTISVQIDSIVDLTGSGFASADLVIYFDARVFEVTNVTLGNLLARSGSWSIAYRVDALAGRIFVSLAGLLPLEGFFQGDLVLLQARVKGDAPVGASPINLAASSRDGSRQTQLNEGWLTLVPAPTDAADDTIDGLVAVSAADDALADSPTARLIGERLVITGTNASDHIMVAPLGKRVRVRVNQRVLGDFVVPAAIVVEGLLGNDYIYATSTLRPMLITRV